MNPIPRQRPPLRGPPDDQHERWNEYIRDLERVAGGQFSQNHDPDGRLPEDVFVDYYNYLTLALDPLLENYLISDAAGGPWDNRSHPIERFMILLSDAPRFVEQHNMRRHLDELRSKLDIVVNSQFRGIELRISYHVYRMTDALKMSMPSLTEVWNDTRSDIVLPNIVDFSTHYGEFLELEKMIPLDEFDRRFLISRSKNLLRNAFQDLRLPLDFLNIPSDFFTKDGTPTYVEFPATSDEFKNGHDGRPGLLSVKEKLGGRLTGDERRDVHLARVPAPPPPPAGHAPPAGPRAYDMTIDNIRADLRDLEVDAMLRAGLSRPDVNRIATPTSSIRASLLDKYKPNYKSVLEGIRGRFFEPANPPGTQAGRDAMLTRLQNWIDQLRESTRTSVNGGGAVKAKEARINVFAIKYLRSLYMQLIWESNPAKSEAEVRTALADRLKDWIFHENVWNTTDNRAINRPSITAIHKTMLQNDVYVRTAKMNSYRGLETQLRGGPGPAAPAPAVPAPADKAGRQESDVYLDNLRKILEPRLPSRTIDHCEKVEKKRDKWARACADARMNGTPIPPRPDLNDVGQTAPANAALMEGPPDYDSMPGHTNWEKLAKMIVMTHWRFYQTRVGL